MKATATIRKETEPAIYSKDSIIRFEEGLIGFSDCKDFVLMENEQIAPLRRLQSTEREDVGFFVLDPVLIMPNYYDLIPTRDWESLGLQYDGAKIVLAICILGSTPGDSTGNLQAPILINYTQMVGKQVILTESNLSSRHPLLAA
jgi:flagellar assembly factor FliW